MASLNKVLLIGNLTRDPEIRRLPTGTAVATLRLAISESFTRRDGGREERTLFLDADVWDRQAEICQQYLVKGSSVFVEGRIQMDEWQDKNSGEKKVRMKIRVERVQFLDRRRNDGGAQQGGAPQQQGGAPYAPRQNAAPAAPAPQPRPYQDPLATNEEEEIPF
jgi:single-strand DNA-binding protein